MMKNRAKIEVSCKGNIQEELIRIVQRMRDVQYIFVDISDALRMVDTREGRCG